jgi:hypothetical protein
VATPEQGILERRLAAILAADIVGYSRLMWMRRVQRRPSASIGPPPSVASPATSGVLCLHASIRSIDTTVRRNRSKSRNLTPPRSHYCGRNIILRC